MRKNSTLIYARLITDRIVYIPVSLFFSMIVAVRDLLFYPDTFFTRTVREEVNLVPAAIIVGAGCLATLAGIAVRIQFAGDYTGMAVLMIIVRYCILPFIEWGILSGLLFGISRLFSGSGSLAGTLQNTGYGMLPWTLSTIAGFFVTLLFFRKSPVVYTSMLHTPQFIAVAIFLLFFFWSCCLWVYAVKHTHRIPVQKASVAVFLSVMVCFLLFSYGLPVFFT